MKKRIHTICPDLLTYDYDWPNEEFVYFQNISADAILAKLIQELEEEKEEKEETKPLYEKLVKLFEWFKEQHAKEPEKDEENWIAVEKYLEDGWHYNEYYKGLKPESWEHYQYRANCLDVSAIWDIYGVKIYINPLWKKWFGVNAPLNKNNC